MAIKYQIHFFNRATGLKIDEDFAQRSEPSSACDVAAHYQQYNPDLHVRVCRTAADGSEVYLDALTPPETDRKSVV